MFNIKKLFGIDSDVVATEESVVEEKPIASDAVTEASLPKGRRGRTLSAFAREAHEAVVRVLSDVPQTRAAIVAALPEQYRGYVDGNWQGLILRLMSQEKARLAGKSRGRTVAYISF